MSIEAPYGCLAWILFIFLLKLITFPQQKGLGFIRAKLSVFFLPDISSQRGERILLIKNLIKLKLAPAERFALRGLYGAGGVTRTPDLLITNQLLYRLSYTSEKLT